MSMAELGVGPRGLEGYPCAPQEALWLLQANELQRSQGVPRAPTSVLNLAMRVAESNLNRRETRAQRQPRAC